MQKIKKLMKKKIRRIEAKDKDGVVKHSWSAYSLLWDELPKSLLNKIEMQ
jgi:hypothetical protein